MLNRWFGDGGSEAARGIVHFWLFPLSLGKSLLDGFTWPTRERRLHAYSDIGRDTLEVAERVLGWVLSAQTSDGGIRGYFSLISGYSSEYPETTGYLIPTLLESSERLGRRSAAQAAVEAGDWLLACQLPEGGFRGGLVGEERPPVVFNSGQALMGLTRLYEATRAERYLLGAVECGDWLLGAQDADGVWRRQTYLGKTHSYHSMVARALASLWRVTGDERFATAARSNLDWASARVHENGWPGELNLGDNPAYLHFLAYAVQGLVETGLILDDELPVDAGVRAAEELLRQFEITKELPGAFNSDWSSDASYWCLVGNAQMSCVWLRLYEAMGDWRYLNAALKMNELLKNRIVTRGMSAMVGGVPGSYPIWGRYQPYRLLNWGAKYLLDAFLGELAARARLEPAK